MKIKNDNVINKFINLIYEKDNMFKGNIELVKDDTSNNKDYFIFYYFDLDGYLVVSFENDIIQDKMFFIEPLDAKDYYIQILNKKEVDFNKLKNMF